MTAELVHEMLCALFKASREMSRAAGRAVIRPRVREKRALRSALCNPNFRVGAPTLNCFRRVGICFFAFFSARAGERVGKLGLEKGLES